MEYTQNYEDGIFIVVTHGDGAAEPFARILEEMLAHPEWKPGGLYLHDHSDFNSGPLTVDDILYIVGLCEARRAELGDAKCALVATRDLEFGLARMWGSMVEGRWDVTANVFRTREDAIAWLKE